MQNLEERIENAARAILRASGAHTITTDENWPNLVRHHKEMCSGWPEYELGSSTVIDAFRAAKAVITSEFGDEEHPRYTMRRMREEISKAEQRGRAAERETAATPAHPEDVTLWVSPVCLRAWQKAKAGEIWAWSENLEGQCIPLYATSLAPAVVVEALQDRVRPWMMACFGPEISADKLERGDRLLEEVFELLQSGNYPRERIRALEDYTYSREKGEPAQEVGGVMITLAAYCLAHGLNMHEAGENELARIWTKVEKIRAKQAAKPTGSALPVAVPELSPQVQDVAAPCVKLGTSMLQALSRLAGSRHKDGTSSIVSAEDRSVIITTCHAIMTGTHPGSSSQVFGPFAHLNGVHGLNEAFWTVDGDPDKNDDDHFSIPLYSLVDPFAAAPAAEQGEVL